MHPSYVHLGKLALQLLDLSSLIFDSVGSVVDMFAEYRTVSGVAGPLVILDKVKVNVVLPCHISSS